MGATTSQIAGTAALTGVAAAQGFLNPVSDIAAVGSLVSIIPGKSGTQPNDWVGWNALDQQYNKGILGTSPAAHVLKILSGGESNPQLVAQNIISWITNEAKQGRNGLNEICQTFNTGHDINGQTVTFAELSQALSSQGFSSEAAAYSSAYNITQSSISTSSISSNNIIVYLIGFIIIIFILIKSIFK